MKTQIQELEKLNNIIKSLEPFHDSYKELCDIADTGKVVNSNEYPKLFEWVKFIMDKDLEIEKEQPYKALTIYKDNKYVQSLCIVGHINDDEDTPYLLSRLNNTFCFEKIKEIIERNSIGVRVLEHICEQKLKCFKSEKDKILGIERLKKQLSKLQDRLSKGSVWIKIEFEHTHCDSSFIKRIEYLFVTNIDSHPSFPYDDDNVKITYNERLITEFRITKGKITYAYDPVWQNSKNYTRVIDKKGDKEFSIISRIPKKIKTTVTEYITKERKRINDWADSWFNFVEKL